eukprot:jgi/Hompol1/3562/HPOL_006617-RA
MQTADNQHKQTKTISEDLSEHIKAQQEVISELHETFKLKATASPPCMDVVLYYPWRLPCSKGKFIENLIAAAANLALVNLDEYIQGSSPSFMHSISNCKMIVAQ